jgi:hypothetical protein
MGTTFEVNNQNDRGGSNKNRVLIEVRSRIKWRV